MSDRAYNDSDLTDEEPRDPPAAPSPMLQAYRQAFDEPGVAPEARDLAYDQTTIINDYQQRRRLADENAAAGQEFVAGIDNFKSGLVKGVQADPFFVGAAFDLIDLTIDGMVSALPNVPDGAMHRDELIRHTQSEVAVAAVTAMAEQDGGAARGMLADERIAGLLGESVGVLDTYITVQERARARDDAAHAIRLGRAAEESAELSARNYLGALRDPNTGAFRSPDGWNQGVISDPKVPPMTKVDLIAAQDRLMVSGDTPTDPLVAMGMIRGLARGEATQRDLYPLIGAGMSLGDASMLMAISRNPAYLGQLASNLDEAARTIAPNGSIAESRALGRFTSALLTQVARGAVLDPMSPDWIMANPGMQNFRVTGDDLINYEPLARVSRSQRTLEQGVNREERRSLKEIFSGERVPDPFLAPRGYEVGGDGSLQPIYRPSNPNRAPFYGVERPSSQMRVGAGAQNLGAGYAEPTEVLTDTGTKQLTAADLRQSTSGPRPGQLPNLSEEQQDAIFDGRAKAPTAGRSGPRGRLSLPEVGRRTIDTPPPRRRR